MLAYVKALAPEEASFAALAKGATLGLDKGRHLKRAISIAAGHTLLRNAPKEKRRGSRP